jgi:DNA polymerase-1
VDKLLLVDGNSLINRAFYATTLTNGATYGFLNMFMRQVESTAATHIAVAFDMREPTFRHKMFDGYKAHRHPMPTDLVRQFGDLRVILREMGIQIFELATYEADDIIGTIAHKSHMQTAILTGDRDCLQLVTDRVYVHLTRNSGIEICDTAKILNDYGVEPRQLIDIKALMGDKSDNIPGAHNVGEKTAIKIIKEHGCVEQSEYANDEMVKKSKTLVTIKCDVPIEIDFNKLQWALPMSRKVYDLFKSRNFNSFLSRAGWFQNEETQKPTQLSMF